MVITIYAYLAHIIEAWNDHIPHNGRIYTHLAHDCNPNPHLNPTKQKSTIK